MKWTTQPTVFEPPVGQIGPAMRAIPIQQRRLTLRVAKQHKILTEHPHRDDRPHDAILQGIELTGQGHWLPILAQQLTGWRVRTDLGQTLILLCGNHFVSCPHSRNDGLSPCRGEYINTGIILAAHKAANSARTPDEASRTCRSC